MRQTRAAGISLTERTVAKVRLRKVADGEPAFFRWLGAIRVGPGSVDEDIRAARRSRGKAARHR